MWCLLHTLGFFLNLDDGYPIINPYKIQYMIWGTRYCLVQRVRGSASSGYHTARDCWYDTQNTRTETDSGSAAAYKYNLAIDNHDKCPDWWKKQVSVGEETTVVVCAILLMVQNCHTFVEAFFLAVASVFSFVFVGKTFPIRPDTLRNLTRIWQKKNESTGPYRRHFPMRETTLQNK